VVVFRKEREEEKIENEKEQGKNKERKNLTPVNL